MTNTYKSVLPPVWTTDAATDYIYTDGNMSVSLPATPYPGTVTLTDGTTGPWTFTDTSLTAPNSSAKIKLQGENADIEINGKSLSTVLESLEQKLGILRVNPELEKDFEELKNIADLYRTKEKEFLEKRRVWEALKK